MCLDYMCKKKILKDESHRALYNIILLSLCFMFVQTALSTVVNAQKYMLTEISKEDPGFTGNPYIAICIFFFIFGIFNWLASSVVKPMGPRTSLLIGSIVFTLYHVQFFKPITWLLYFSSLLLGIGGSIFWAGQALYLSVNSNMHTISRNIGIFWVFWQTCMLFGNLYLLCFFKGDKMDWKTRQHVLFVLIGISTCGIIAALLTTDGVYQDKPLGSLQIFLQALKLSIHRDMLLISLPGIHTGVSYAFITGIYSNTLAFDENIQMANITVLASSGILVAIGNVSGGFLLGIFGNKIIIWGRYKVVLIGCLFHVICGIVVFLNVPNKTTIEPTTEVTIFKNNVIVALICSFFMGFADACFNTQLYGIIWTVFVDKRTEAFSLFRFIQSYATAFTYIATLLGLYVIVGSFIVTAIAGTVAFCIVCKKSTYIPTVVNEESIESIEHPEI